jgi:hypothetical protein
MPYDEIVEFVTNQLKMGIKDINEITNTYLVVLSNR